MQDQKILLDFVFCQGFQHTFSAQTNNVKFLILSVAAHIFWAFSLSLYIFSLSAEGSQQNQKDSRFIRISLPVDIDFSVQNLGLYCCFLTNQIFDHSLLNMSKLYNRHTTGYYSLYWDSIFDFILCRLVLFSDSCIWTRKLMNQEYGVINPTKM